MKLNDWKAQAMEYRDVDREAQARAEAELALKIDARRKIGRCANGAERGKGFVYHAIQGGRWVAMCGAQPGRQSAGWQSEPEPVERVNCPRCLKKLRPTSTNAKGTAVKATVNVDGLHHLASFHRKQVLAAKRVGCFCCLRIFDPKAIKRGCDARGGLDDKTKGVVWQTACCPHCFVDSILPDRTFGFRLTRKLLVEMEQRWFGRLKRTGPQKGEQ